MKGGDIMKGFAKKAYQKVKAEKMDRNTPAKKAIEGNDLRAKSAKK